MEHILFELQLCIEILIFKEKSNFGYTDHPEITTSLPIVFPMIFCRHLEVMGMVVLPGKLFGDKEHGLPWSFSLSLFPE